MALDERTKLFIAVGASVSANCRPCLKNHSLKALQEGVDVRELLEAIEVGKKVREAAAWTLDRFAETLSQSALAAPKASQAGCGCSS